MHGSMGGGRRPATVGHAARRQAPLAYPTNLRTMVEWQWRLCKRRLGRQRGAKVAQIDIARRWTEAI